MPKAKTSRKPRAARKNKKSRNPKAKAATQRSKKRALSHATKRAAKSVPSPRKVIPHPKGRRVNKQAFAEVDRLLGDLPRRKDLLIEYLHRVQDHYHCLSESHLAAVAHELRISFAEVYEVATFYAHFDVVRDGDTPPPPLTVRVCDSLSCAIRGSEKILAAMQKNPGLPKNKVRVVRAPCMGHCDSAPVAEVGHHHVMQISEKSLRAAIKGGKTTPVLPRYKDLKVYEREGGYEVLRECLSGKYTPESLIALLEGSNLKGMGGAGFPAGTKWKFVRKEPGPRLMTVNADEGEPGTFKDRFYLEHDPHRFLEGALIAAWAVGAPDIYVYLRDEYPHIRKILRTEIDKIAGLRIGGGIRFHLRRGAGAYICGEESAMIESLEGKRGLPRHRPPYISTVGLFGRPTLNHNVETLYWVRDIVEKGPEWFAAQGRNGGKGLRSYSVSGRVKNPGVKLAPAGITIRELIEEYCGGMEKGHRFKAYLPGGASGGILPASMDNIPLDFGTLEKHGCFIGSAAVIVLSDKDNLRDAALNLLRFFEDESCGQCTPCRVGTEKAVAIMEKKKWDKPLLEELCRTMRDASICGLGQAAPNPIASVLKHFPEEVS